MASAPRSFWKGHLRLALVTIPIRLVSAAASEEKLSLHQVDRKSKSRIRYQKVASETGQVVNSDDIVSAFEVEPGQYILLEDDELDALKLQTRHTVELTQFVDADAVDPMYFERPYYVLPDGDVAEEGYRIIRDALRAAKKYGIGQLTMRGRENLVALKATGNGLMLETLRYENEVKNADDIFSGISSGKLRPELIKMAEELIEARSGDFDPGQYQNHYAKSLKELVETKLKGGNAVEVAGGDDAPSGGTIIDFMEALKKSTGRDGKTPATKDASPSAAKKDKSAKPKQPRKTAAVAARDATKKSKIGGPKKRSA